jgi:hypothetical protein
MLTEHRLARNKALIRSLNQRVAVIAETLDTFGSLKFMCECGIYACRKRIELTASDFEAIRSEPTHFLVHPDHVLYALEFVVLESAGSHVVVEERVSEAARPAVATDPRDASEEPPMEALALRLR